MDRARRAAAAAPAGVDGRVGALLRRPVHQPRLEPSSTQQLWIFDVYGFVLAGLLITMGSLGDRIGRRRLLLIGAASFSLASLGPLTRTASAS